MVFFKKVEVRDQKQRFGGSQRGLFALERIEKGEKIWYCECGDKDGSYTRDQLCEIIKKYPKLDYFIRSFSYMIDDDLYALPYTYMDEKNNDECALFNHSCNPTCGFADDACGDNVVALCDIEPGEELTYHYGILETESSLIQGLICKCNTQNCCGKLTFDYYRDPVFVAKYFDYMTPYLKKKSIEIQQKWYSTNCYVKRFLPDEKYTKSCSYLSKSLSSSEDSADDCSLDLEDWRKGLCSLNLIRQDELVATFASEEQIYEASHYLKNNSNNPNCYILGKNVYARYNIEPEVELTVDFDMRSKF